MNATPAALIAAARKCGRDWADQINNDEIPAWSELTPDDIAWIEKSHPRLFAALISENGPGIGALEPYAKEAYEQRAKSIVSLSPSLFHSFSKPRIFGVTP